MFFCVTCDHVTVTYDIFVTVTLSSNPMSKIKIENKIK